MLLHEFKAFYSEYAHFDVTRKEDGAGIDIYLLWSCSEEQFTECLVAGVDNVDVRLSEENSTRDRIEVSVFFEDAHVSTEVLAVPNTNVCSELMH